MVREPFSFSPSFFPVASASDLFFTSVRTAKSANCSPFFLLTLVGSHQPLIPFFFLPQKKTSRLKGASFFLFFFFFLGSVWRRSFWQRTPPFSPRNSAYYKMFGFGKKKKKKNLFFFLLHIIKGQAPTCLFPPFPSGGFGQGTALPFVFECENPLSFPFFPVLFKLYVLGALTPTSPFPFFFPA